MSFSSPPARARGVSSGLLLAVLLLAAAAGEAAAPPEEGWRIDLRGLDVTRAAGPLLAGGVLLVDAAALGPSLGLQVRATGREVTVRAGGGIEWRGAAGDTRLATLGRIVPLERPLRIEGASVYLPIEAVAELARLRLVLDPDVRTASLLDPAVPSGAFPPGWQAFTVAKPAAEGSGGGGAARRARQQRLLLPPDHDTVRLSLGIGAVPGADWGSELTATGSAGGIETAANALLTSGPRGFDFQSGHAMATDPARGWGAEAGDLFSEVWGFARGARFRWQRGEPGRESWPALSVYLDDVRSGNAETVLSYSDEIHLGRFTVFGGELASDGSWVVNGRLRRERLSLAGHLREASGRFESRGLGLSGSFELPGGLSLQAALSRDGPRDRPLTGQAFSLRIPLRPGSDVTLETVRSEAARLRSRTDALAAATALGRVQLRSRYQRRQTSFRLDGNANVLRFAQDELFTSVSWLASRRLRLEVQIAQRRAERGELDSWGQVNALFALSPRTSLQLFATSSSSGLADAFRLRIDRELGPGFSWFAEYGDVVTFQPPVLTVDGDEDRSRVRVMLRRSWDVATPASGSGVEGAVKSASLPPLAGLPVELGPYRTVTDGEGRYSFPHVPPGAYDLRVPAEALPADLAAGPASKVQVQRGRSQRVDLPLVSLGEARGWVYVDRDGNGRRDSGEGVGGAVLILDGRATSTAADGSFGFFNLPPGTHEIRIETGRLVASLEAVPPLQMGLGLPPGQSVDHLEFRLHEKRKPVVFQEVRK